MHFFIDYTKLDQINQQILSDGYGPDSSNPTNIFHATSRFQPTANARAYSPLKGFVIIQPHATDVSLVNVILKPQVPLKINFTSVKYFVFRGIKKDSYFTLANEIIPQDPTNNELVAELWTQHKAWKISSGTPTAPDPDASVLGYNSLTDTITSASTKIDSILANQQVLKSFPIEEGKWIGTYSNSVKVGFEIVLEEGDFIPDLNYARANTYSIDVSGISDVFDKKTKREEILNFIDPAAFFGLFFFKGVKVKTEANPSGISKSGASLYEDILDFFASRNRVYLDIRNEIGYSLNFYGNYNDGSGNSIKLGDTSATPVAIPYKTDDWPIASINGGLSITENRNTVKLHIRIDDNTKPLVYLVHAEQANPLRTLRFLDEKRLLPAMGDGYTKEMTFKVPNFDDGSSKLYTPWYIKMHYCRQKDSSATIPNTVLKTETYTDNIFGPINLQRLGDSNDAFRFIFNQDIKFIEGILPGSTEPFGFIAERGVAWDDDDSVPTNDNVIFFARTIYANKRTSKFFADKTGIPQTEIIEGLSLNNNFWRESLLKQRLKLLVQKVIDTDIGSDVNLLIMDDNGVPPRNNENLLLLSITQSQFNSLKNSFNTGGFKTNHHGYLKLINEDSSQGFYKYDACVHGLDSSTKQDKISSPLFSVYSKDGIIFVTKDFADSITVSTSYTRNPEEDIGARTEVINTPRLFVIKGIDSIAKEITVEKIITPSEKQEPFYELPYKKEIEIIQSASNNGTYTVKNVTQNGNDNVIKVHENIPSSTIDGSIRYDILNEDYFIALDREGAIGSTADHMRKIVNDFQKELELVANDSTAKANLTTKVNMYAPKIFARARAFVQRTDLSGNYINPDDRILYWARIKMEVIFKSHPFCLQSISDRDEMIKIFEEKSRGYTSVDFSGAPSGAKKILITGFDPFFLNQRTYPGDNILQSNPSGCVALAFNSITTPNGLGYIQSMIVPVRYPDFDGSPNTTTGQGVGIIEQYIQPWIGIVDMIITISQAGPGDYNIDRWATATRGGTRDNLGYTRNIPEHGRSIPISIGSDLEWIETTLPSQFISAPVVLAEDYVDENGIPRDGGTTPPVVGKQMRVGPGGDYLSNEIFYRVAKLRKELASTLPTGHFHIAMLQETLHEDFSIDETNELLDIVKTAINNGVTGL